MKKDWVVRALKTFWQAALSALCLSLPEIIRLIPNGWEALMPLVSSTACGALAAGISAVYNGLIKPKLAKESCGLAETNITQILEVSNDEQQN